MEKDKLFIAITQLVYTFVYSVCLLSHSTNNVHSTHTSVSITLLSNLFYSMKYLLWICIPAIPLVGKYRNTFLLQLLGRYLIIFVKLVKSTANMYLPTLLSNDKVVCVIPSIPLFNSSHFKHVWPLIWKIWQLLKSTFFLVSICNDVDRLFYS